MTEELTKAAQMALEVLQHARSFSTRTARDKCPEVITELQRTLTQRQEAQAPQQATPEPVGEPWGWAIEDKHGAAQSIRPARKEFFGCVQSSEPFTAEDVSKMDREWAGLVPHRIVTLYTRPAPVVPEDVQMDAERYRKIRQGSAWPCVFASHDAPEPLTGGDLDAAIDAARKGE